MQKKKLDEQTKKANSGEKYKQKVQANQNIEKERDSLREDLDEARSHLVVADKMRRENAKLRQEHDEMSQTLQRSEQEHNELQIMKKEAFAEIKRLNRDLKGLHEKSAQYQERVADLEDRSVGSEVQSSPTVVDGGLESELAETSMRDHEMQVVGTFLLWTRITMNDRKSRIVELENHARQLMSESKDKDDNVTILRRQLEKEQDLSAEQFKEVQSLRQEISLLQTSIAEVQHGHPIEGCVAPQSVLRGSAYGFESTETFRKMREHVKMEQRRNIELQGKLSAAESNLHAADKESGSSFECHCMMRDLCIDLLEGDLINKPKLELIEEEKKQQSAQLTQLQNDYQALQSRHDILQVEYQKSTDERNQAWHESHEALIANTERDKAYQELTEMIQQASSRTPTEFREIVDAYATRIGQGREHLFRCQQVQRIISSSDLAIHDVSISPQSSSTYFPASLNIRRPVQRFVSAADIM